MDFISLSPSKLNVLKECPRCFYDANVRKVDRPRGIFPSLPGGVDRVMKMYSDQFRGSMIPELRNELPGTLWGSVKEIDRLRNWRSGLKADLKVGATTVGMIGALDDLVIHADGTYSPFDTKTKGKEPESDGREYYQEQMDIYALFLRENGMQPSGKAYLCYWYPVQSNGAGLTFQHKLYELTASPERAIALVEKAVAVLTGAQPAPTPGCEYCTFASKREAA